MKTDKQGSKATEGYLLTVLEEGNSKRDTFVEECQKSDDRFEEPIKKSKILNIATENFSKKNKSTQASRIQQAKGARDISGRLLFLAIAKRIDVKRIFAYPLVPEPPCFCHPDGSLRDSSKSKVFQYLKGLVQSDSPPNVETVIADGTFLIKIDMSLSYLQVFVQTVLKTVLKQTVHRADICFNVYESSSLKDSKRQERGDDQSERKFSIGSQQKMPSDLDKLLKLSRFKKELLIFFFEEIEHPEYAPIIGEKVLYCAINNECQNLYCRNGIL